MLRWAGTSTVVLGLALGCAAGVETPETTTLGPAPGSASATDGSEGATFGEGDDDPSADVGPSESSSGWPPDDTTTSMPGTTSGVGDESSSDDGSMGDCANLASCAGASPIGSVSGDESSGALGESGSEPTWLAFQVTENDDSLAGAGMSFTATLTSTAGADFDLYVYRGVEGGASGCNGFAQSSTSPGAEDEVEMSWGEGVAANGIDDGVWVAVEIRAKNELCAPPQEWTLTVEGNT